MNNKKTTSEFSYALFKSTIYFFFFLKKKRQATPIAAGKGIRFSGLYRMTITDSIINTAKMISDYCFSRHIPEALRYRYKYIKCRSDYFLGRDDKRHILQQGAASMCLVVNIYWVHTSKARERSIAEVGEIEIGTAHHTFKAYSLSAAQRYQGVLVLRR